MTEMTVKRSGADGSHATYRVTVRERTDRTVHEVTVSHGESRRLARAFASTDDLVRYIFEALLTRQAKEDIPSAFALKDLLAHEPDVACDLYERAVDPDAGSHDCDGSEHIPLAPHLEGLSMPRNDDRCSSEKRSSSRPPRLRSRSRCG